MGVKDPFNSFVTLKEIKEEKSEEKKQKKGKKKKKSMEIESAKTLDLQNSLSWDSFPVYPIGLKYFIAVGDLIEENKCKLTEKIKFNGLNLSNEIKVGDLYTLITKLNGDRHGKFMACHWQHF